MKYRVELDRSRVLFGKVRWYWRLVDTSNGKTLAHSEIYARRIDAMATAHQLAEALEVSVTFPE